MREEEESVDEDSEREDPEVNERKSVILVMNCIVLDEDLSVDREDRDVEGESEEDDESRVIFRELCWTRFDFFLAGKLRFVG